MRLARFLNKIIKKEGLILIGANGKKYIIGNPINKKNPLTLKILNKKVEIKLLLYPDFYFGKSYMDGDIVVENGDISDVLEVALKNIGRSQISLFSKTITKARGLWRHISYFNTKFKAKKNVQYHYDLGDQLYDMFLDKKHRQYSCAYWNKKNLTLEDAQEEMINHIIKKLNISNQDNILDIGCGWGGLAIAMAQKSGCRVTGITLSHNQLKYAKRRARELKVDNLCDFRLEDYRDTKDKFSKVVSKGMIEHTSRKFYKNYFNKIYEVLKPKGVALIHGIGNIDKPGEPQPWISRFIFPGGFCPSLSQLIKPIENSKLVLSDLEMLPGFHYAETLKHWRIRFLKNKEKALKLYDSTFVRMWNFYLSSCEMTFRHTGQQNFQLLLSKDVNVTPKTRDYIYS